MNYINIFHQLALIFGAIYTFMGVFFIISKTPDKDAYRPYRASRLRMGCAFATIGITLLAKPYLNLLPFDSLTLRGIDIVRIFVAIIFFSQASFNFFDRSYLNRRRYFIDWGSLGVLLVLWVGVYISHSLLLRYFFLMLSTFWLVGYLATSIICYARIRKEMQSRLHEHYSTEFARFFSSTFRCMGSLMVYGIFSIPYVYFSPFWQIIYLVWGALTYMYIFYTINSSMLYFETVEQRYKELLKHTQKVPKSKVKHIQRVAVKVQPELLRQWVEDKEYTNPGITIERLAQYVGTNRNYLSTYINEMYHLSFSDWVAQLRVEYAKQLLLNEDDNKIESVATVVGFSSSSYFCKVFARITGLSPTKWKEQMNDVPNSPST